jgi:acyl carrier protein
MTTAALASYDDVLALVLRVVRAAVDAPEQVGEDTQLLDLPSFDSMTIVAVAEEIERSAGVEIDPDRIVPETFASARAIADTVWSAGQTASGQRTDAGGTS